MKFNRKQITDTRELAPEPAPRAWTEQQVAVFDHFSRPDSGNVVVEARAGTGKTTVVLEGIRRAPEHSVLLAAFNTRIAAELKTRAPSNATVKTLAGVGYQLIRRAWGSVDVDTKYARADSLAERACPPGTDRRTRGIVSRLHTKVREQAPRATTAAEVLDVALDYDIMTPSDPPELAEWALVAVRLAAEETDRIDFADMIFLPLRLDLLTPLYDLVVVDEAQDMAPAQLEIARGVCGGRFGAVGDPFQAIYGFRGADSHALERVETELGAVVLGLTTTFRCGEAIAAEARRLVPDLVAHPSTGAGQVLMSTKERAYRDLAPGDFLLSRTNAPLIGAALACFKTDKKCKIEGRDVGKGLLGAVDKLSRKLSDRSDVYELVEAARDWSAKESARAVRIGTKAAFGNARRTEEKAEMLELLAEGLATVGDLSKRIDVVFADVGGRGEDAVVCSTVHKAKGLERNRAFLLRDTFNLPPPCAGCGRWASLCRCVVGYVPDAEARQEERNIEYVAITRAKKTLVWVEGEYDGRPF